MDLDLEKFKTPIERLKHPKDLDPTFQSDVLWLTNTDVEQIENRIRNISIPFFLEWPSVAGLDGTRFEFRYDAFTFGGSLNWWQNFPAAWRPFTETVMQIAAELEERRKNNPPSASTEQHGQ
jgi:hypothetical protein